MKLLFIFLSFALSFAQQDVEVDDYWFRINPEGKILLAKSINKNTPYAFVFKSLDEFSIQENKTTNSIPLNGVWGVSNIAKFNTTYKFNMTLLRANVSLTFAFTVRFPNASKENMSCPYGVFCLKFDVVLSDYQWRNDTQTTQLVLVFNLHGSSENVTRVNGLTANVEGSYFSITPGASVTNNVGTGSRVNVSLNVGTVPTPDLRVVYGHFPKNCTLFHDPLVGITVLPPEPPPYEIGADIYIGLAISLVVILVIVTAGTVYLYIKKKNGYDAVG